MTKVSRDHLGGRYISTETSRQIVAARLLCIFFMMSVHVNPGFETLKATPAEPMFWIGGLWVDVLGRSSVPALSIISGFLMAAHFSRRSFGSFALDRFRTLYVPMLFWTVAWAGLALMAYLFLGVTTPAYQRFFDDPFAELVIRNMLYLYGPFANLPLGFLRDLFVCSLLAFGLQHWLGRWVVICVPLSALIWQTTGYGALISRPSIPTFLLAGIALQQHVGHLRPAPVLRGLIWGLMALIVLHQWFDIMAALERELPPELWQMIFRIVVSIWALDMAFRLSQSRFFSLCQRLEPVIFLAYLSHGVVISSLWAGVGPLMGGTSSPVYPLFFLAAPPLALLVAYGGDKILNHVPSWGRALISGKMPRLTGTLRLSHSGPL